MLVQLSPHTTNVGLIPTISLVTHWCPLALTGPTPQSTSDRLHTRAHTDLIPAGRPLTGPTHEHTRAYTTRVCTGTRDCGSIYDTNCWNRGSINDHKNTRNTHKDSRRRMPWQRMLVSWPIIHSSLLGSNRTKGIHGCFIAAAPGN